MRLIDADNISFYCNYEGDCTGDIDDCKECGNYICDFRDIQEQPTAYDIDKVVEELEKLADENYKAYCIAFNSDDRSEYDAYTNAIEIVKQGGVGTETGIEAETIRDKVVKWNNHSSKKVPYEFIDYVEGKRTIDVEDDVCEWKYTKEIMDNAEFKVGCNQNALKRGIVPNNFSYHDFKYCPYCGKKIKVVE